MKKRIIIILLIILLLGGAITSYFLCFKNHEDTTNTTQESDIFDISKYQFEKYNLTAGGIGVTCTNVEGRSLTLYDRGQIVECGIGFELSDSVKEIWAEYEYDSDLEFLSNETNTDYKVLRKDNRIYASYIRDEKGSGFSSTVAGLKLKIKSTTEKDILNFKVKNIYFSTVAGKYYSMQKDDIEELMISKTTNYKYTLNDEENKFTFYKFSSSKGYEQIGTYQCSNDCHEYASQYMAYMDMSQGKMFILDGTTSILYDFNRGILGKYEIPVMSLDANNESKYFIVSNDGKYGIIDNQGNIIKDFISEGYGIGDNKYMNKSSYSIKDNLIIEKKNNKYGVVSITEKKVLIDYKYDEIRLYNSEYLKIKIGDLWFLFSYKTKDKVITTGYKEIFMPVDNIIITQIDKYLYIKDYQGNNIIEDKIEVLSDYNEMACCGSPFGIYVTKPIDKEDTIEVIINSEPTGENRDYKSYIYFYDIKNKTLTKKDS